ncbi:MAG: diguanylate cyclase domain-containing protein [Phycisphaerae bacterium]
MAEALSRCNSDTDFMLLETFDQSGEVQDQVEACARELALANSELKAKLFEYGALDGVHEALTWSERIEKKIQHCADELRLVNTAMAAEIVARKDLEKRLSESTAKAEKHRYMAFHDVLTGLVNRALFENRLNKTLIQAQRHQRSFAIMFLDINHFKNINDIYGHDMGDKVLRMVAERLQASVRAEDTVSRIGGDEFMCLLMEVKEDAAIGKIAQSIIARISESCGPIGVKMVVQPSIGIAICPRDGTTRDILLKNADLAMYQAKADGTRYCFASSLAKAQIHTWKDMDQTGGLNKTATALCAPEP